MGLQKATAKLRETITEGIDRELKRYGFFENEMDEFAPSAFAEEEVENAKEAYYTIKAVIQGEKESNGKSYKEARDHYLKEASFTFFNRMVGIKIMEANELIDEAITERKQHGGKSLRHNLFLTNNSQYKGTSSQGRKQFFRQVFQEQAKELPDFYRNDHQYGPFVPDSELIRDVTEIINEVPLEEWKEDDTLGWVYQYYNQPDKTEVYDGLSNNEKIDNRDKLIAATQLYTEDYMVDYLVENSLGRLWLEHNPDSDLREQMDLFDPHPELQERSEVEKKPVEDITIFDPACGSGHFLLKAFDLFYEMYVEAGHEPVSIPAKIIENNLFGTDLDERAVQIAIIALYIKASAKKKEVSGSGDLELTRFNLTPAHLGGLKSDGAQWLKSEMGKSVSLDDVQSLLDQLDQIDTYGSLVNVRDLVKNVNPEEGQNDGFFSSDDFAQSVDKRKDKLLGKLKEMTEAENLAEETLGLGSIRKVHLLSLLVNKYDVVATNPPYMSKGNMGGDIKSFLENHYPDAKSDIYASFIKACMEFSHDLVAMINMHSFMFIKSFQDLRKFILQNANIETMAHLGTDGFGEIGGEVVNTTMYTLRKNRRDNNKEASFIRLVGYSYNDKLRELKKGISSHKNQDSMGTKEFEEIPGSPFVYWAFDKIGKVFKESNRLGKFTQVPEGITTGNNDRFLRLWWEIFNPENLEERKDFLQVFEKSERKWFPCIKGGPEKRWYGNLWWIINWANNGNELKEYGSSFVRNESKYFKEGFFSNKVSSREFSVRYMPQGHIFEHAAAPILLEKDFDYKGYAIGFLNSKLCNYFLNLLNPTMHYSVGNISSVPTKNPDKNNISISANENVIITKHLTTFSLIERNFQHTPLDWARNEHDLLSVDKGAKTYIDYEYTQETKVLLNESVIDEEVFELYELKEKDVQAIFEEEGKPAGYQPLLYKNDLNYLPEGKLLDDEFDLTEEDIAKIENLREDYVKDLPIAALSEEEKMAKENEVLDLYDGNEDLRDISTEAEVNPLSVLRIIKETNQVPLKKGREIVHEFLFDKILKILRKDQDGIVPLSSHCGEDTVYEVLQRKLDELSYESYEGFESYLKRGRTLEDWLYKDFFEAHAKRFSYRTYKGAIVWHITSGKKRGFDAFVLHHKWNKDNLKKLRTVYFSQRREYLENRLNQLDRDEQDKEWRETREKLDELEEMEPKLKELENDPDYDPEVDDGVGKNIAPLQDKVLTSYEILSSKQKQKYLEADW